MSFCKIILMAIIIADSLKFNECSQIYHDIYKDCGNYLALFLESFFF